MRVVWLWALVMVLLAPAVKAQVLAEDYRQFWLWGGVHPQAALDRATDVYVLQGEVMRAGDQALLQVQGATPTLFPVERVWLVYRVRSLDWSPRVIAGVVNQWQYWKTTGTHMEGIQLDFDARTYHLAAYADFLRELRRQLPRDAKLSITGLLDWTKTGDVGALNGLRGTLDEMVVQTYKGRSTVPDYARYLSSLSALRIPFKVGLVQGGAWDPVWQARLGKLAFYRGEVVFLVNATALKAGLLRYR